MSTSYDHSSVLQSEPFCSFCLRERPSDTEFYKHVNGCSQELQRSLQSILGYDFNLANFAICKPCWKVMQLIQDFRLRCFKANEVVQQVTRGLTAEDGWFSVKNLATIESVRMSVKDQLEQIGKINVTERTPDDFSESVTTDQASVSEVYPPGDKEDTLRDHLENKVADKPLNKITRTRGSNKLDCKKCSRPFSKLGYLIRHMDTCGTLKPTVFTCHLCFLTLPSQDALKEHVANHPFRTALNCRMYCEDHFFSEEERSRHEKVCIEIPQTCMVCGKVQQNKETLRAHLRKVHPEEKTFACKTCGKRFRRKDTMLLHERTIHTENRYIFPCEVCGQMFTRRECVLNHARKFHPKVSESTSK